MENLSRSTVNISIAPTLGGLVSSGFSHSAGVCDTWMVIALSNASGVRTMNLLAEVPGPSQPTELCLHSGLSASEESSTTMLIRYEGCPDRQARIDRAAFLTGRTDAALGAIIATRKARP
jgi:hypothetical protein